MLNVARQLQEISTPVQPPIGRWRPPKIRSRCTVKAFRKGRGCHQPDPAQLAERAHCFFHTEQHWYLGKDYATTGEGIPYGHFNTPLQFYRTSREVTPAALMPNSNWNRSSLASTLWCTPPYQGILAAIAPCYQRHPASSGMTPPPLPKRRSPALLRPPQTSSPKSKNARAIANANASLSGGPGEIGGAVVGRPATKRC